MANNLFDNPVFKAYSLGRKGPHKGPRVVVSLGTGASPNQVDPKIMGASYLLRLFANGVQCPAAAEIEHASATIRISGPLDRYFRFNPLDCGGHPTAEAQRQGQERDGLAKHCTSYSVNTTNPKHHADLLQAGKWYFKQAAEKQKLTELLECLYPQLAQ